MAFAALVNRHGPLVLRTCQAILGDEHEAQDAFQATFLVLVRKARSIWVRDSLGPWLHQVACRTASCARSSIARRIEHERRYAGMDAARWVAGVSAPADDLPAVLHEELNRLAEKFRVPLVLCDLEGRTHEQAARQLHWPIGTVKTRLTRGRRFLRERLARRGVGLSAALAAIESLSEPATAAVPTGLARTTVGSMIGLMGSPVVGVALPARVTTLAEGVLRGMLFIKLRSFGVAAVVVGLGSVQAYSLLRPVQAAPDHAQIPGKRSVAAPANATAKTDEKIQLTLDEALLAAKAIPDPSARRSALVRIGNAQAVLGDRRSAQATLLLAHASAEKISSEIERDFGLWRVARMQAQVGDVVFARRTFQQLARIAEGRGVTGRVELLSDVAKAQAQAGLGTEALATIKKALDLVPAIEQENLRNHGLFQVLQAQMLAGDFDAALKNAESLKDKQSPHRASFLQYIAGNCDSAGREQAKTILSRALELARGVVYPYPRAMAQAAIAQALARNGDIAAALKTARSIGEPTSDDSNPGLFASLFGARDRARRRAEAEILGEAARREIAPALVVIATEQAKANDRAGSKATFREAFELIVNERDAVGKNQSLRILVTALAGSGELGAAREAIKAFQGDEASKAVALVALARAQAKVGDKSGARDCLRAARREASGISRLPNVINDDPTSRKDESLQEIGLAQAEMGEIEDALATVASHGTDGWKAPILAQIAAAQARAGDVAGALKTAETIRDDGQKAEGFSKIAQVQAEAGKHEDALAWAGKLRWPQSRALALLGVVEGRLSTARSAPSK
jgi:RNA polymerase sigma factor (sigma-70 family)